MTSIVLIAEPTKEYELLDSGHGQKLERYGSYILSRPDPQALWNPQKPDEWGRAQASFVAGSGLINKSRWHQKTDMPERWPVEYGGLKFWIKLTPFKHTGLFPEQIGNWMWIQESISQALSTGKAVSVLNLFGYTGGASLAAAQAGADVTHVDGSKAAITWARENAELSGLAEKPIRWILDDAQVFLRREVKRGKSYDAILMDPPAFGRGPKGEVWKIEDNLPDLLNLCTQVLSDTPLFIIINGYASGYSPMVYQHMLTDSMKKYSGIVEAGELAIKDVSGRLLPAGIVARWKTGV